MCNSIHLITKNITNLGQIKLGNEDIVTNNAI